MPLVSSRALTDARDFSDSRRTNFEIYNVGASSWCVYSLFVMTIYGSNKTYRLLFKLASIYIPRTAAIRELVLDHSLDLRLFQRPLSRDFLCRIKRESNFCNDCSLKWRVDIESSDRKRNLHSQLAEAECRLDTSRTASSARARV